MTVAMSSIRVPNTFWHPEVTLPRPTWHPRRSYDDILDEERSRLLESYKTLKEQEAAGQVSESVVVQTILSAWALKRSHRMSKDPEASRILAEIPSLAKKYGLSRVWQAALWGTMARRVDELYADGVPGAERFRCGRCGRTIRNPLSVKRGLGPICFHKPR